MRYLALALLLAGMQGLTWDGTDAAETVTPETTPGTTEESDDLRGFGGDDTLDGGGGDDEIRGGDGEDKLFGGPGDDFLDGGADADRIEGGPGNDLIEGSAGEDWLEGQGGDDVIDGDSDDDTLWGGAGNDTLSGEQEKDRLFGQAGFDVLRGGDESDYLDGGEGADAMDGGTGSDLIVARGGDDAIYGNSGDDFVAIVGNSIEGYTLVDGYNAGPNGELVRVNEGADMICFVRDINPDQVTYRVIPPFDREILEFDTGLQTLEPVTLDLPNETQLEHFEAFRMGEGDDTIVGRDITGLDSYGARFLGNAIEFGDGTRFIQVDELFFVGAGDDTVTTGPGNDLVDLGEGDDVAYLGPGEHYVITGPGADTLYLDGTEFDGQGTRFVGQVQRNRIADFGAGDVLVITGGIDRTLLTLEEDAWGETPVTKVVYDRGSSTVRQEPEVIDFVGWRPDDFVISETRQGISIRLKELVEREAAPVDVTSPPRPGRRG